ncbi:MAG TPA: biotin/lipoyl-containing protein, partial [Rhizobacter sp.]|nr:biotin/lipoyl-containing protein [Rhizobacter sp.]
IRVAAGEKLPFTQADVKRDGWAMECRINAEDPFRSFLPSTGRLVKYAPPPEGNGVRVDTGVYEGGEIPMYYDSMIAKLIVHGKDRAEAITKMRAALNAFAIRGISSNIPFQAALLAHPKFVAGDFNTGFIAEHYGKGFTAEAVPHDDPMFLRVLAAVAHRKMLKRATRITGQMPGHEFQPGDDYVVVTSLGEGKFEQLPVSIVAQGAGFDVNVGGDTKAGKTYRVAFQSPLRDVVIRGSFDGEPFCAQIEAQGLSYRISHNGTQIEAKVLTPRAAELNALMPFKAPPDLSKFLLSPMPGLLVDVAVTPGQKVMAGEKLAVIEAMKMENILLATQDCVVAEVAASKGESLSVDQVIIKFQ